MTPEIFLAPAPPPNILIVDDTVPNLELLAGLLRARGHEARPATSGKQALVAAQADPPDLILLDIKMPEMDGFEVCRRLKADGALKEIPVIFITALTETEDKVTAFAVGAADYVTKPFQADEVAARVRTHLRIGSLHRQLGAQNEHLERQVAERTRELAKAYERQAELGRLKDDFLLMLSHELRTPANGLLGIGELILDLCPASEECTLYSHSFRVSSARLRKLIEDAMMITDLGKLTQEPGGESLTFSTLLDLVMSSLPEFQISMACQEESVFLKGDPQLLHKGLETMIRVAAAFSLDKHRVQVTGVVEAQAMRVRIKLDAMSLSPDQAADFFQIESQARAASAAEPLALAPVVAHRIITAFGGELRLHKGEGTTGYLEAVLLKEPNAVRPA